MSRNLYIAAAALLFCSLVAFAMTFATSAYQPGLPVNGTLWKTASLLALLGGLIAALFGVLTAMFEQVARRDEHRRQRDGGRVIEFPAGRAGQEKYSPRDRPDRRER